MTSNDSAKPEKSATVSRCETPIAPLKQQNSFEERYAGIINQQILENTINKDVLQRQVQAFFTIGGSSLKECAKKKVPANKDTEEEESGLDEQRKILQRFETLDIKDEEQT